jgi:YVTN family beta-propeller protein
MKKLKYWVGIVVGIGLLSLTWSFVGSVPPQTFAQTLATPTPLPLFALPNANFERAFTSGTLALLPSDGRTVISANMLSDSATIFAPAQNLILDEVPVGSDPRAVAITPDSNRAVVANRGDNTLSVINIQTLRESVVENTIPLGGVSPVAVVVGDNRYAYVALQDSNQIAIVDLDAGEVISHIETPPAPTGLALWGDFLYVTHFHSGDLSLIYLPQGRVIQTASTGNDTGLANAIVPDITRGIAYIPETRLNTGMENINYDAMAIPMVNTINLRDLQPQPGERVALDTADRPVNMPFAAALDRFAQRLYIVNAGSNDVTVIDLTTGFARAHVDVGSNPRGVLLNGDNSRLYVHNVLDNTITTIDTATLEVVNVLPISQLNIPADLLIGQQLFYSAANPQMSAGDTASCATCHFDGIGDGRVWHGFSQGAANTQPLFGLPETPPYTWLGTWDELADVELKIRAWQAGAGLIPDLSLTTQPGDIHAGLSPDLDSLTTYLVSLQPPDNPLTFDTETLERGEAVFAEQECASCHVGTVGTDLRQYDVGTGGTFDTPGLRWLWLSPPYLHDGRAETLRDVFMLEGDHQLLYDVPPEDIDALVAYLLAWVGEEVNR